MYLITISLLIFKLTNITTPHILNNTKKIEHFGPTNNIFKKFVKTALQIICCFYFTVLTK